MQLVIQHGSSRCWIQALLSAIWLMASHKAFTLVIDHPCKSSKDTSLAMQLRWLRLRRHVRVGTHHFGRRELRSLLSTWSKMMYSPTSESVPVTCGTKISTMNLSSSSGPVYLMHTFLGAGEQQDLLSHNILPRR